MVKQNILHTHKGKWVFSKKNIRFMVALDLSNALNRSNNGDCSLRAILGYHLIKYHDYTLNTKIAYVFSSFVGRNFNKIREKKYAMKL